MPRPFLTARWSNLILANYPIPESLLRSRLPRGLEPDRRQGTCWCSLVAFQFQDTRVLGVGWPGFRQFPEWNLRCYVRYGDQRGVIFIRELVPSRFVAWVARAVYNEPYAACAIGEQVHNPAHVAQSDQSNPSDQSNTLDQPCTRAEYWVEVGGRRHTLAATGHTPYEPAPDSDERWFTDQSWGYGVTRRGQLATYRVTHPLWSVYRVIESVANVDWEALYGSAWAELNDVRPASLVYAVGSAVQVYPNAVLPSAPAVV